MAGQRVPRPAGAGRSQAVWQRGSRWPLFLLAVAIAVCSPPLESFCQGWLGLSADAAQLQRTRIVRNADFNFKLQRGRRKIRPGPTRTSVPMSTKLRRERGPGSEEEETKRSRAFERKMKSQQEELRVKSYAKRIQRCDEVQAAKDILAEMREEEVPLAINVWTATLGVCANASASEAAKGFLKEMTEERITPSHDCYHLAMDAGLRDPGAPADFVEVLFKEMQMRGLMPTQDTYTRVIRSYLMRDNEKLARRTFREAWQNGLLNCWQNRGLVLQLTGFPLDVATFILRVAIIDRANELAGRRKAGKTTMHVLTRQAGTSNEGGLLEREVLEILRGEFGLKAKLEPSDFGRIRIRGSELERFGLERKEQRKLSREKVGS